MTGKSRLLSVMAGGFACVGTMLLACVGGPAASSTGCAAENASAQIEVSGTYSYTGKNLLSLKGTITFEQQGGTVRVTDTTYNRPGNRALVSEFAPLAGNKLVAALTPKNGDTNYRADVTFLFTEDGQRFCAEFSDTNGDAGGLGAYNGFKQ